MKRMLPVILSGALVIGSFARAQSIPDLQHAGNVTTTLAVGAAGVLVAFGVTTGKAIAGETATPKDIADGYAAIEKEVGQNDAHALVVAMNDCSSPNSFQVSEDKTKTRQAVARYSALFAAACIDKQ
ncbi:MAG: hypothetical protein ACXVCP_04820 [Bdellovibrio sp.]